MPIRPTSRLASVAVAPVPVVRPGDLVALTHYNEDGSIFGTVRVRIDELATAVAQILGVNPSGSPSLNFSIPRNSMYLL